MLKSGGDGQSAGGPLGVDCGSWGPEVTLFSLQWFGNGGHLHREQVWGAQMSEWPLHLCVLVVAQVSTCYFFL